MNSNGIVLFLVVLYFLGMLLIGWWSSRKIKDLTDFMVAGRRLGLVLATATMFATWFGGESVMGAAGTVYEQGLRGVVSDPFGASLALILAGLFYAVAFRRLRLLTVVDTFGKFYSKGTEVFAALLMIPVYIGWLGAQIVATGLIFSALTNIEAQTGMIIGTLVTLLYTFAGGMWAVTLTDFVQMAILIVGILVIFPFTLHGAGGLAKIFAATPQEFFHFLPIQNNFKEWIVYLGKWFIMGLGCVVGQDLIQRSLSSKDEKVARWSAIFAGFMYLVMGGIVILIALGARLVIPNLGNTENVVVVLAEKYLGTIHPVLYGLFICGLLAAIMSSGDSSLLAAVSLFVNNILRKIYPQMSEFRLLRISRWATVVVVLLSMFIALYVGQVYNLMVNSWATLLVAILVPTSVALFWPKSVNTYACWASMISGIVVWSGYIIYHVGAFVINDANMDIFYAASFYGFLASISGYSIFYLGKKTFSAISKIFS